MTKAEHSDKTVKTDRQSKERAQHKQLDFKVNACVAAENLLQIQDRQPLAEKSLYKLDEASLAGETSVILPSYSFSRDVILRLIGWCKEE